MSIFCQYWNFGNWGILQTFVLLCDISGVILAAVGEEVSHKKLAKVKPVKQQIMKVGRLVTRPPLS